ncbi:MAG: RDD family protein [Siphonobacter sp.]
MQQTDDLVLASVGNRFLANLIDNIIIGFLSITGALALGIPVLSLNMQDMEASTQLFTDTYTRFLMVALPISFLYRSLQEGLPAQATIGKRVMKLKVVKVSGKPLQLKDGLVRNLVKELSGYLYMVYLVGLFSPLHQCLHDLAARTYVVDAIPYKE